jgi:hypothetical protein
MDMIRHQAKGMDSVIIFLNPFSYETEKPEVIRSLAENLLARVPAHNNVVNRPCIVNSWFPGHKVIIFPNSKNESLTPFSWVALCWDLL